MKTFVIVLSDRYGFERRVTAEGNSFKDAFSKIHKNVGEFVIEAWEVE